MLHKESLAFVTHFLRAYPARTALMVALLVLAGVAEGIGILTLIPLIEVVTNPGVQPEGQIAQAVFQMFDVLALAPSLAALLAFIVIAMALKGLLMWLAISQVGYMVAQVATDLRLRLIRALMQTRWSYFVSRSAGTFANAISTEAQRTAWAYRRACQVIASGVQLLIYLSVVAVVSWKVAVLALLAGTALIFLLKGFVRMSRTAGSRQTTLMKSLVERLTEILPAIKSVKAMARGDELWPLLERETEAINHAQRRAVLAEGSLRSMQEPVFVLLIAVGLYASLRIGGLPFSMVVALVVLFYRAMACIGEIQTNYQHISVHESAFHSLQQETSQAVAAREETRGQLSPPPLESDIRLDRVSFSYGSRTVLEHASLQIPAGAFATLTGASGTGKTTLIDLLTGLLLPQDGKVLIDGVPLADIDLEAWRRRIGYVPQEVLLFHETVYQNVSFGNKSVSSEDVRWALQAAGALGFVEALPEGLQEMIGPRGATLSGGQQKRIAIARALIGRPKLLILDEATTALDPKVEAAVCDTLRSLSGGITVVAISHQSVLRDAADVVYEVSNHRVHTVVNRIEHASVGPA